MKKTLLLMLLATCLCLPAFAQTTPTITGTWTGTTNVNSDLGLVSQAVTVVISGQSGGNWWGTITIASAVDGTAPLYGRIDSLLGLWQTHAASTTPYGISLRVQGFYTPAVPLVSVASITLDGEEMANAQPGYPQLYDAPCVFHVVLTQ